MAHFLEADDSATGFATNDYMADYTGLTIRAQIAAMCLQGILSNPGNTIKRMKIKVETAVDYADLLIEQLNETS